MKPRSTLRRKSTKTSLKNIFYNNFSFHELLGNGNGRKTKMPFSSGMKSGFHNPHFNAAGAGYVDGDNEV